MPPSNTDGASKTSASAHAASSPPATGAKAGWKYGVYVSPLDEGDIDHTRVLRLLKDTGYDGDVCIEDESLHHFATPEERIGVLERDVAHVKGLIEALP